MALDVILHEKPAPPIQGTEYEHILAFEDEDEGYYWFLYPLFRRLNKRSGQMIDLYGTAAIFGGDDLDTLEKTISSARQLTESQPDEWEVVIGFEIGPARTRREIRQPVNKANMLSLLDKLQTAIAKAREKNHYLVFLGD